MNHHVYKETNPLEYEPCEVTVRKTMAFTYVNAYLGFGWSLEKVAVSPYASVTLSFRRPRILNGNPEAIRLQRDFEAAVGEIEAMERQQAYHAAVPSVAVGLTGALLIVISLPACFFRLLFPSIGLMVLGLAGCVWSLFLYSSIYRRKSEEYAPLFLEKYRNILEIGRCAANLSIL